jgi:hypothetical protein
MRIISCIVAVLFSLYAVVNAMLIAHAGAMNQIVQLEAAGAAELMFAGVCFLGAVAILWRWWLSLVFFVLATLWSACVAIIYFDNTIWVWCAATAILAAACAYFSTHNQIRRRKQRMAI